MEFNGNQTIAAPRHVVWAALNDPAVLQACVPGCESFIARSDDEFEAVVQAAVGPVKARFKGGLALSERRPDEGYRIAGKGEGGIAGFGKMQAVVDLADAPEGGTLLTYHATAEVGGKLAQVGSRLVASVANRMADEFFKRFGEQLAEPAPEAAPAADDDTPAAPKKWWQRG
jgi:uncharacterized protein